MQNDMTQEINMSGQHFSQDEGLHAGSKRSSPPTVQSDSDDLNFPSSPGSDLIVQTTKSKGIVNVQLFIRKAFAMINECDPNIAAWTEEGDKFVVKNKDTFASTVIPQYYDHNNYSSFTRQLNFYGFTREQSMTIKVSDLNSLAVGQETFHHQHFQRGRPDLLKNLQRRSTDTKSTKKRKKPRLDGEAGFIQARIEAIEDATKEMLVTMQHMRDEAYASAAAIQNLQNINSAKDEKISNLEKRIDWLERRLATSALQRETSYINPTPRLNLGDAQGMMNPTAIGSASNYSTPSEMAFSNSGSNMADNCAPTLARHPRMKKNFSQSNDIFSFQNNVTNIGIGNYGTVPSRETSLDFGLLSGLARESTLMSWLPRPEDKNLH
jgi:hypothetical protein